jgi:hypothetical protein
VPRTERIVVVWYYDPALTDEILWPHAARTYLPRWPTTEAEGLGSHRHRQPATAARVFPAPGSGPAGGPTSLTNGWCPTGWAGCSTNVIARTTTYDPSRIQQPVKVYVQNDASLGPVTIRTKNTA